MVCYKQLIMKYLFSVYIILLLLVRPCTQSTNALELSSDTIFYDVVFRESISGIYKKWSTGPESQGYYYTFTDRGRGPQLREQIVLNNKNFIISQSINGVNYLKDQVEERFSSDEGEASWNNPGGQGNEKFDGNELYFRYDGSPAIYEILARLLLQSKDGILNLYPKGEAELVQSTPFKLSNNQEVSLLMIKGLDMNPSYIWVEDGALIARIEGNLHVIRQDAKAVRLEMKRIQDSLENEYLFEQAKALSQKVDDVVIQSVNVFQVDGTIARNRDVFVEQGIIKEIVSVGTKEIPENVMIIDGQGKTLMPGMFDMHTHNNKFRGALHIAGGVTSVRDLANNKQVMALGDQFNKNEIIGPHIVTYCGIIDGPGPYANKRNAINNLEEGLDEVQIYKDMGYQQIKLYSSIKPEWVPELVEKSHHLGMRVSGHIPAFMTASQAIGHGFDEIQHLNMLFLNFLSDTIDTRTPLRFTMVAKHGADLDLESKEYLDFVNLLKENDILVDPTISIFENMFVAQKGKASPTYDKIVDRLPLMNQRSFYSGGLPKPEGTLDQYRAAHNRMLDVVYNLYTNGVDIVPGTDGLPGFLYHRELELYVSAGIPASEVLKMATIISAEITGVSDEYGSIETGKRADLILVDGNPLENISEIRRVEWTMKGGYLFHADKVYSSMGIKHFK